MSSQLSPNPSTSQTSVAVNVQITQQNNNSNNNICDQKTNLVNLNTIAGKRNALNVSNRVNKRPRTECEESDYDINNKMSENTIAVNNNQNNRYSVSPNGVSKGAQLANNNNNTKPGTAKKLVIKNFGKSFIFVSSQQIYSTD